MLKKSFSRRNSKTKAGSLSPGLHMVFRTRIPAHRPLDTISANLEEKVYSTLKVLNDIYSLRKISY